MNNPINILYVHGYLGSGNGQSSKLVRGEFESHGIPVKLDAPQFPVTEPRTMHEKLNQLLENNTYDFIVASSLGAFYVMQIPGVKKILVNIAIPDNLRRIMEEDPGNNPYLTDSFLKYLENEKNIFFSKVFSDSFKNESFLIFGYRDNIAPNDVYLKQYFDDDSAISYVDMEHKLDCIGAKKVFKVIMKQIK